MPELPEVQTVVSELNRKLRNRTIKSVEVNAPKMVAVGPGVVSNIREYGQQSVARFISLLKGRKVLSVKRRAKLLIFDLSGKLSLLAHLKMTGQFIFEDGRLRKKTKGLYRLVNSLNAIPEKLPSKHTHVIFTFQDGSHLYFNDVRKFGYLKLVRGDELNQVKELREYGPEPLSKNFTPTQFLAAVKKRVGGKIKQVLMDPKVVAGIGNIYSDEILFRAKIRPARKVSSLSEKDLKTIYAQIPIVLKQAIKAKGSSVGDFIRTDGSWGTMGKHHFVYGRSGLPCKVCGTAIQTVKIGGRTGSFCPKCQD
ncbi:MAG: bifunctional DNA-formamidopyrimidine glycosylase/DNA-(apurinic or apyrimidinic site) lyase [Patescibacteria group bacterium]|nr:bifunctional DNA-formamidopyrimidine glycosylase/DNA-(apurinic or apyrimidinic site) lyase [Patescibacteria group bacterium]